MSRFAVFLVLGLAACEAFDSAQLAGFGSGDMQGWRSASGKRPTRAEYAAFVAACQDGTLPRSRGKALDACLADLGLRRE
jgi:hypothetical protein